MKDLRALVEMGNGEKLWKWRCMVRIFRKNIVRSKKWYQYAQSQLDLSKMFILLARTWYPISDEPIFLFTHVAYISLVKDVSNLKN